MATVVKTPKKKSIKGAYSLKTAAKSAKAQVYCHKGYQNWTRKGHVGSLGTFGSVADFFEGINEMMLSCLTESGIESGDVRDFIFRGLHLCTFVDCIKKLIDSNDDKLEKLYLQWKENNRFIEQGYRDTVTQYAVCGDFVDVGRYMGGEPECMIEYVSAENNQFKDVYIRLASVGSQHQIFGYYSNILEYIDQLENSGTRCRVIVQGFHTNARNNTEAKGATTSGTELNIGKFEIVLKEYNQPLNQREFCNTVLNEVFSSLAYKVDEIIGRVDPEKDQLIGIDYRLSGLPKPFRVHPDGVNVIEFPSLYYGRLRENSYAPFRVKNTFEKLGYLDEIEIR